MQPMVAGFVLCAMLFSCEKEEALPIETTSADDSPMMQVQAVDLVALEDIKATVEDGRLVFADIMEFAKARKAVSESTREEVAKWSRGLGFSSMRLAFHDWLEALPDDESVLSVEVPFFAHQVGKGEFRINSYSYISSDFANEQGEFKIGSSLHSLADGYHITIMNGDESLMAQTLSTMIDDRENGIYVIRYDTEVVESGGSSKAADLFIDCPNFNPDSEKFDDSRAVQQQIQHRITRGDYRMDAGVRTVTTYGVPVVPFASGVDVASYSGEAYGANYRKKGFKWIGTQPSVTVKQVQGYPIEVTRLAIGTRQEPGCNSPSCVPKPASQRFSGPIPSTRFTTQSGVRFDGAGDFSYEFDSGVLISNSSAAEGRFFIKGIRYELIKGRVSAQWNDRDTEMHVRTGCTN